LEPYEKLLSPHRTALLGKRARMTSQLGQSSKGETAGEQGRVAPKTEGEEGEGQTGEEEEEKEEEEEQEGVFVVLPACSDVCQAISGGAAVYSCTVLFTYYFGNETSKTCWHTQTHIHTHHMNIHTHEHTHTHTTHSTHTTHTHHTHHTPHTSHTPHTHTHTPAPSSSPRKRTAHQDSTTTSGGYSVYHSKF